MKKQTTLSHGQNENQKEKPGERLNQYFGPFRPNPKQKSPLSPLDPLPSVPLRIHPGRRSAALGLLPPVHTPNYKALPATPPPPLRRNPTPRSRSPSSPPLPRTPALARAPPAAAAMVSFAHLRGRIEPPRAGGFV
jgi:hypothetical protein